MSSLRRSLWGAAAAAFLAGVAVGLAIPAMVSAGAERELTADEKFVERLTERYDLDAEQRRQLHCVLQHRNDERDRVIRERFGYLDAETSNALSRANDIDELISMLLTDEQRALYLEDQGVAGTGRGATTDRNK